MGGGGGHDDGDRGTQRRADPRVGLADLTRYCGEIRTRSRLGAMPASQHTIAGRVLTMPVKIRRADLHMAGFSVDADAAQRLINYSGLQVYRYLPGRALVELILTEFVDGDLGAYHEFSTCVMVNPPGSNASGLRALQSAFTHQMLVDQAFTLEAGRAIWGFPKVMAEFTIREGDQFGFDVSIDGQLV